MMNVGRISFCIIMNLFTCESISFLKIEEISAYIRKLLYLLKKLNSTRRSDALIEDES